MERGECWIALRQRKWATISRALHGRARQAVAPTKRNATAAEISNLKFQILRNGNSERRLRSFWIRNGGVDIVDIREADGARRMPHRVTPVQIAHIFGGRYTGGQGDCFAIAETIDPSPRRGEIQMPRSMSTERT